MFQVCKMSGEEAVQSPGSDPDTLDLSGADLEKLSRATPELILNTTTLVLDNNKLQRLDNIHTYQCLEKVRDEDHKSHVFDCNGLESSECQLPRGHLAAQNTPALNINITIQTFSAAGFLF